MEPRSEIVFKRPTSLIVKLASIGSVVSAISSIGAIFIWINEYTSLIEENEKRLSSIEEQIRRQPVGSEEDRGPIKQVRDIEFRSNGSHIQWRYEGEDWKDLVAFSELNGAKVEERDSSVLPHKISVKELLSESVPFKDVLRRLESLERAYSQPHGTNTTIATSSAVGSDCIAFPATQRTGTFLVTAGSRICGSGGEFLGQVEIGKGVIFRRGGRYSTCGTGMPCKFLESDVADFVLDAVQSGADGTKQGAFSVYPK